MDEDVQGNGVVKVKFGPNSDDWLPLGRASQMLTWLLENEEQVFMAGLAASMGVRLEAKRAYRGRSNG